MLGLGIGIGLGHNQTPQTGDEPLPRKYLFIDAGFLQSFNKRMRERVRAEFSFVDELTMNYEVLGGGFDRVFYYDAYPEKKETQEPEAYDAEYKAKEDQFNTISRHRNYSVRTALTKNRARGRREQKGVDVLLAIDVLQHAVRGNIDEATIMTSDTDFFPLFEALLQTKTKSVLRYDLEKTSLDLINSADFSEAITAEDFLLWHRDSRIFPGKSSMDSNAAKGGQEIGRGFVSGKRIKIFEVRNRLKYAAVVEGVSSAELSEHITFLEGIVEKRYSAKIIYDET